MKQFIPCLDNPANVFSVSVYKPQRGPAVVTATEGRVNHRDTGFTSFETELFGKDRHLRCTLDGNNTKGNRIKAMQTLVNELAARGWVSNKDAADFLTNYKG